MRTFVYERKRYFIAPLFLAGFAIFSAILMVLWNILMPVIFNLPAIRFWQAAGLIILTRLLFGFHHPHAPWAHRPWRSNLREKLSKMTPEERREFYKKMHTMRHSWHEHDCCKPESAASANNE